MGSDRSDTESPKPETRVCAPLVRRTLIEKKLPGMIVTQTRMLSDPDELVKIIKAALAAA